MASTKFRIAGARLTSEAECLFGMSPVRYKPTVSLHVAKYHEAWRRNTGYLNVVIPSAFSLVGSKIFRTISSLLALPLIGSQLVSPYCISSHKLRVTTPTLLAREWSHASKEQKNKKNKTLSKQFSNFYNATKSSSWKPRSDSSFSLFAGTRSRNIASKS